MFRKSLVVLALVGMCALSLLIVSCGNSSNRPQGLLYVISQAELNISSFAVDLDNGNLSLITENMPATCASGSCGVPTNISLDPPAATAFVLNQTAISGYTINSDGSLSSPATVAPTASAPVPLGPMNASARDAAGAFMVVISPGVLPYKNCSNPPVTDQHCPSISVYSTTPKSTTIALTGNDCSGTPCPYLLDRVPTAVSLITYTPVNGSAQTLVLVTSNVDLTTNHNDNELSVFLMDSSGNLTEQPNSPYTANINPSSVLAVNTNPVEQNTGGIFVYVGSTQGNSGPGAVQGFQVCSQITSGTNGCTQADVTNNLLIALSTTSMASCQDPVAMLTDPTNSFLYIACYASNYVYAFHMITGTGALTALTPPSVPGGTAPYALAMHPNYNAGAQFLFVSDQMGSSITVFDAAVTTGTLTAAQTVLFLPGEPSGIAGR